MAFQQIPSPGACSNDGNRSPGLASFYWRTFPPEGQWLFRAFVRFTVTGIARKSHPYSHDAPDQRSAAPHGADPSADSFVVSIIPVRSGQVNESINFHKEAGRFFYAESTKTLLLPCRNVKLCAAPLTDEKKACILLAKTRRARRKEAGKRKIRKKNRVGGNSACYIPKQPNKN